MIFASLESVIKMHLQNFLQKMLLYQELIDLCKEREIYIISTVKPLNSLNGKNVYIINFYKEIQKYKDYLMADGIHLTEKGNARLNELINEILK